MFNSGNCGVPITMNVEPSGTNNNSNGWGGDGAWLIWIVLIFAMFGWGGNGWGGGFGGNGGGALTRADLCSDMNFSQLENGVRGISQGICDSTFALNNSITSGFAGMNNAICDLGYTLNTNIMQGNFGLQNAINSAAVANMQGQNAIQTQISDCCCKNQVGQMQIQNQMQADTCALQNTMNTNTRDTIDNANSGIRAIMDKLCQMEYNGLNDKYQAALVENQSLRTAQNIYQQNAYLTAAMDANKAEILRKTGAECPTAAYIVQPPQPVTFPTNCCGTVNYAGYGNNGCGCAGGGCC